MHCQILRIHVFPILDIYSFVHCHNRFLAIIDLSFEFYLTLFDLIVFDFFKHN